MQGIMRGRLRRVNTIMILALFVTIILVVSVFAFEFGLRKGRQIPGLERSVIQDSLPYSIDLPEITSTTDVQANAILQSWRSARFYDLDSAFNDSYVLIATPQESFLAKSDLRDLKKFGKSSVHVAHTPFGKELIRKNDDEGFGNLKFAITNYANPSLLDELDKNTIHVSYFWGTACLHGTASTSCIRPHTNCTIQKRNEPNSMTMGKATGLDVGKGTFPFYYQQENADVPFPDGATVGVICQHNTGEPDITYRSLDGKPYLFGEPLVDFDHEFVFIPLSKDWLYQMPIDGSTTMARLLSTSTVVSGYQFQLALPWTARTCSGSESGELCGYSWTMGADEGLDGFLLGSSTRSLVTIDHQKSVVTTEDMVDRMITHGSTDPSCRYWDKRATTFAGIPAYEFVEQSCENSWMASNFPTPEILFDFGYATNAIPRRVVIFKYGDELYRITYADGDRESEDVLATWKFVK